jgi:GT2 family glycosyltransferase
LIRVTVVIPTFNRAAELARALRALHAQTVPVRVCVVDNGSSDDTSSRVNELHGPWQGRLDYIWQTPQGPASARNKGLSAATTEFVLFHDSDVELTPQWVERALAHMDADPSLAAAGGYILYAFDSSRVNAYGGDMGRFGLAWDVDEGITRPEAGQPARRIWINCSAMLARADAIRECGGFDASFFYAHEDSDLGWRLNALGRKVAVFPDLAALHHVDSDPGIAHPTIVFHYTKNRLASILQNASLANVAWMAPAAVGYTLADALLHAPRSAKLRALGWVIGRLPRMLGRRWSLQRARRVRDREIFSLGEGRWFPPTRLRGRRRRAVDAPAADSGMPRGADDRV